MRVVILLICLETPITSASKEELLSFSLTAPPVGWGGEKSQVTRLISGDKNSLIKQKPQTKQTNEFIPHFQWTALGSAISRKAGLHHTLMVTWEDKLSL